MKGHAAMIVPAYQHAELDLSTSGQNATVTPPTGMRCAGLYVGVAGDLDVKLKGGSTRVVYTVPSGVTLPVNADVVYQLTTDASNIVALFVPE